MSTTDKMPLAAVGMIAAHLFLERIKIDQMLPRDLARKAYGYPDERTYGEKYAEAAAADAWMIAAAVQNLNPQTVHNRTPRDHIRTLEQV